MNDALIKLVATWREKVALYRDLTIHRSDHACHDDAWRQRQEGKAIATACRADELEAILTAVQQEQKHDWRTGRMGGIGEFADERVTACERCGCELNDDNRNEACPQQNNQFADAMPHHHAANQEDRAPERTASNTRSIQR